VRKAFTAKEAKDAKEDKCFGAKGWEGI
jgi:hypothetical protein